MQSNNSILSKILNPGNDNKIIIIRIIVGFIFITEGLLKYKQAQWLGPGRFEGIGFDNPFFWAYFTGAVEIISGTLILFGLFIRPASIPLLIVMLTALVKVKLPLIGTRGIWIFMHEYTTDFALTLLLIILIIHGGGKWSADMKLFQSRYK